MVGRRRTSHPSALAAAAAPRPRRLPRARWHALGLAAALASTALLARPGEASAAPSDDDRPWSRGVMRPSFGLSPWGLLNQEVASLSFGLGFNYYIINGLSLGLGVSDTVFIYRSAYKARYPGIETQLPTNMLEVTPTLQYVFFRSRRFSPYVYGGVGPVFFNHGAGTHGQWVAGPGVYINVTGPLYVSLGVGFSGLFPGDRCKEALTYRPQDPMGEGVLLDLCSFRWGPQAGLVVAFGGGRSRERRPPPRERDPVPASNPLDETVAPEPEPEPPTDVGPSPDEATPPVIGPQPDPVEGTEPPVTSEPTPGPTDPTDAPPPSPTNPGDLAPPPATPEPAPPAPAPRSTDVPPPSQPGKIAPPR